MTSIYYIILDLKTMKTENLTKADAIHCDTEEKAKLFFQRMHLEGMKWCHGKTYLEEMTYTYGENTCFYPKSGKLSSLDYAKENRYNVISFDDFMNNYFLAGVYWAFSKDAVFLKYFNNIEETHEYDSLELIKPCVFPKVLYSKWDPELKVPRRFWTKDCNGLLIEREGQKVSVDTYGIIWVEDKNGKYESNQIYVQNL